VEFSVLWLNRWPVVDTKKLGEVAARTLSSRSLA
jgi:hypothetical protein